jgi:hypothetical protein
MKINKKTLLKSLIISIPLSLTAFYFIDNLMGFTVGGLSTTVGFPIPYYHNVFETPEIEYYNPVIKFVDIFIFYIITSLISYFIIKDKQRNIT